MIVAFTGKKGSGKSTCSQFLIDAGYKKVSFAEPLKAAVSIIFGFDDECYDPVKKEKVHEDWNVTPRELLQKIGSEWFRDGLKDLVPQINLKESIWIKIARKKIIELLKNGENVVIDDLRFEDEFEMIKELGGKVIMVCRDENINFTPTHQSENGCSYDTVIDNNKNTSLKDLEFFVYSKIK